MGKSLGNPKMSHLARMVHATKAQVTFVSEIKSSKTNANDLIARFNMSDAFVVPSRGRSSGRWLIWTDDIQVLPHSSNHYIIIATATIRSSNFYFGLVCIYGDPYHRNTNQIWDQVATFIYDNASLTVICIGDMNELPYDEDKSSLNINRNRINAFRLMIKNRGLFDLAIAVASVSLAQRADSHPRLPLILTVVSLSPASPPRLNHCFSIVLYRLVSPPSSPPRAWPLPSPLSVATTLSLARASADRPASAVE
uniref:Uncharacterized protein n=2 Tax=Avena sativa TaxID=4498 RepID=A0ACD5Z5F5_AVESA